MVGGFIRRLDLIFSGINVLLPIRERPDRDTLTQNHHDNPNAPETYLCVLFPKPYSDVVKLCPRIFLPLGEGVSLSD